jgi:hypothetical protein
MVMLLQSPDQSTCGDLFDIQGDSTSDKQSIDHLTGKLCSRLRVVD